MHISLKGLYKPLLQSVSIRGLSLLVLGTIVIALTSAAWRLSAQQVPSSRLITSMSRRRYRDFHCDCHRRTSRRAQQPPPSPQWRGRVDLGAIFVGSSSATDNLEEPSQNRHPGG